MDNQTEAKLAHAQEVLKAQAHHIGELTTELLSLRLLSTQLEADYRKLLEEKGGDE